MEIVILIRYLHFVAIFGVVSSLVAEHLLLNNTMTREELRRVSIIDAIYGVSALSVLVIGLGLWFYVGKPSEYYSSNWVFHIKVGLFLIVGLLSIIPTVYFLKNRKGNPQEIIQLPKHIKRLISIELVILFILPLLATMMAHGIGAF